LIVVGHVVGLSQVFTMAVDWLANNVYIMDSGLKRMVICAMSTSICTSIHIASADHFVSIALNPHSGQVELLLLKLNYITLHSSYLEWLKYKTAKPQLYTVYGTGNCKQLGRKWSEKRNRFDAISKNIRRFV